MAKKAMDEIYDKGKLPIIAGGTGFYIQALLKDIDFTETGKETDIRSKYHEISEKEGAEKLYGLLKQKDPKAAEYIHPNNVKRVIRALEFFDETGECISEHNTQQSQKTSPYTYAYFVLNDDRAVLYDRINRRVDKMLDDGLLEEVTRLKEMGLKEDDISMKGIGYREFFPYFRGEISLEEAIEAVKADSRHFAKRQITWFKREKDAIWFDRNEYDNDNDRILAAMISKWKEIENESY